MKGLRSIAVALSIWCAMCGVPVASATTTAGTAIKPAISHPALRTLVDRTWERSLRESPQTATYIGDVRFNDRWRDMRPEAI
ncbi:MAG: hypothetical protein ACK5UX_01290, partial [Burkholderiales bacterium]